MKKPNYRKMVADVRRIINDCDPDFADTTRMVLDVIKAVYPDRMSPHAAKVAYEYGECFESHDC